MIVAILFGAPFAYMPLFWHRPSSWRRSMFGRRELASQQSKSSSRRQRIWKVPIRGSCLQKSVSTGRTRFTQWWILTWTRASEEFGATILFAGNLEGVTQTMPMAIYLGFKRNFGIALALSVVRVIVSVVLRMFTKSLENTSRSSMRSL
jgi:hypothetical protein